MNVHSRHAAWFAAILSACAYGDETQDTGESTKEAVVGFNDWIQVNADGSNIPVRYKGAIEAIGILRGPGGQCTATHIGNGLMITAGHCFDAISSIQNERPCGTTTLQLGYRDGTPRQITTCTVVRAMQDWDFRDWAIFEVSDPPDAAIPPKLDAGQSWVNQAATLFSHPAVGDRYLQWSQSCLVTPPLGVSFDHNCDAEGGSSGGAVIEDSSRMAVGIHNKGDIFNHGFYLGATPLYDYFNQRPWAYFHEAGDMPFVTNRTDGSLHVFFRTQSNTIKLRSESGYAQDIGGPPGNPQVRGGPVVGRHPNGGFDVFVIGNDNAVWHKFEDAPGGTWSNWISLGGWVSDVVVGTNLDGRLELFAVGSDSRLYQNWELGVGSFSGWFNMSGPVAGKPAVVRHRDGRMMVLVRAPDGQLMARSQVVPSGGWEVAWTSLGSAITGSPTAMLDSWGTITIFVGRTDGAIWSLTQSSPSSAAFGGWIRRSASGAGDPIVATQGDGGWDVYQRDVNRRMSHAVQGNPGSWQGLGPWSPGPGRFAVGRKKNGHIAVVAPDGAGFLWIADRF